MPLLQKLTHAAERIGRLFSAFAQAILLGLVETAASERGRRILAFVTVGALLTVGVLHPPLQSIDPGVFAVRVNRLTGGVERLSPGAALVLPWVHAIKSQPAGDQVYRPAHGRAAEGPAPYKTAEGLSVGVDLTVRYALDPANGRLVQDGLPDDIGPRIIEPVIDAVAHRELARRTVREIYATERTALEQAITEGLAPLLAPDGVLVRAVFIGRVDLPVEYRAGLDALLAEELATQRMKYTLELKAKQVEEAELTALADKARREKAAEASAQEEIIAAKAREEAMRHILPLKEREIQQRRLEAEASSVSRLKLAETEAEARRIEAGGEADYRRRLAESEAYRVEVVGKASSEQLARDAALIAKNPLLIQKTLADKLSDKIQVIIAPPEAGGFFAGHLLGPTPAAQRTEDVPAVELD